MSSGRLLWSETGDTGVAVAEMASPGPWEEGHSLSLFPQKQLNAGKQRETRDAGDASRSLCGLGVYLWDVFSS